jgi:hypothetical protein
MALRIADWARALGARRLALLWAYFDESGLHANAPVTLIAGLVGSPAAWQPVEDAWAKQLQADGIFEFHANHCRVGRGEYAGMEEWRRTLHFEAMVGILARSELVAVVQATAVPNWANVIEHPDLLKRFPKPYNFCAEMCLQQIAKLSNEEWGGERVNIVLSDQQEYKKAVLEVWEAYRQWPEGEVIGGLSFLPSDPEFIPLQAADLIANESYQVMLALRDHTRHVPDRLHRIAPSPKRLLGGFHTRGDDQNDCRAGIAPTPAEAPLRFDHLGRLAGTIFANARSKASPVSSHSSSRARSLNR